MASLISAFTSYPTPVGYMPELVQSLVNVDDCATGLRLIAERGSDGDEFILCADAVPFRTWFELIAAGAGRRPPRAFVPTSVVRWSSRPAAAMARWVHAEPDMITDTVEMATRHQAFSGDMRPTRVGLGAAGPASGDERDVRCDSHGQRPQTWESVADGHAAACANRSRRQDPGERHRTSGSRRCRRSRGRATCGRRASRPTGSSTAPRCCRTPCRRAGPPASHRRRPGPRPCEMPRVGAQATPAMGVVPGASLAAARGTSMRDSVLTGPFFDQPRGIQ